MPRFIYTGQRPDNLASGRPVVFGDEVELTAREQEANARLFESEDLCLLSPSRKPTTTKESDR